MRLWDRSFLYAACAVVVLGFRQVVSRKADNRPLGAIHNRSERATTQRYPQSLVQTRRTGRRRRPRLRIPLWHCLAAYSLARTRVWNCKPTLSVRLEVDSECPL